MIIMGLVVFIPLITRVDAIEILGLPWAVFIMPPVHLHHINLYETHGRKFEGKSSISISAEEKRTIIYARIRKGPNWDTCESRFISSFEPNIASPSSIAPIAFNAFFSKLSSEGAGLEAISWRRRSSMTARRFFSYIRR